MALSPLSNKAAILVLYIFATVTVIRLDSTPSLLIAYYSCLYLGILPIIWRWNNLSTPLRRKLKWSMLVFTSVMNLAAEVGRERGNVRNWLLATVVMSLVAVVECTWGSFEGAWSGRVRFEGGRVVDEGARDSAREKASEEMR